MRYSIVFALAATASAAPILDYQLDVLCPQLRPYLDLLSVNPDLNLGPEFNRQLSECCEEAVSTYPENTSPLCSMDKTQQKRALEAVAKPALTNAVLDEDITFGLTRRTMNAVAKPALTNAVLDEDITFGLTRRAMNAVAKSALTNAVLGEDATSAIVRRALNAVAKPALTNSVMEEDATSALTRRQSLSFCASPYTAYGCCVGRSGCRYIPFEPSSSSEFVQMCKSVSRSPACCLDNGSYRCVPAKLS